MVLVGDSNSIRKTIEKARRMAASDASVLICGETGTGKELFADFIHQHSLRAEKPLIKVNCAAIPDALLENELFGHVRGAFTDAHADKPGRFELAHGGTLFLDEIAELPLLLQSKILRTLQTGLVDRIGSTTAVPVSVRIIAATNRSLQEEIDRGSFRSDLYYRLNVLPLNLPPLRERKDDIPLLAEHFIEVCCRRDNRTIPHLGKDALGILLRYDWPGNVRELQNTLERAVVMSKDLTINPEDLGIASFGDKSDEKTETFRDAVLLFKKNLIYTALVQNGWNQSSTAKQLAVQRTYLSRLIRDLGITREKGDSE